jgi:ribosomal protein S18 acetylase RimI-like enzyme
MKKGSTKIKRVTTQNEIKQFFKIFDYWHKKGLIGFVPLFILYRAKDNGELFVLKEGSKVIGISWLIPRKRPYEFVQMKTLGIDKDYIGQGYGKYFLDELIDPIHKAGFDITTSVISNNSAAKRLYKQKGFKKYEKKTTSKGIETDEMIFKASTS